jgi:hypothetical protein
LTAQHHQQDTFGAKAGQISEPSRSPPGAVRPHPAAAGISVRRTANGSNENGGRKASVLIG